MKYFCLIVIAVWYGPWCPANKESWYVLKIMGLYFSGIINKTKLPLSICHATMRPPRPSSTAECLRLIARLRGEQASAASWEPRPPFEATEMD